MLIKIREATMADVPWLHQVDLAVLESIPDKELFCIEDKAFLRRHIQAEGFTLIACAEDVPAAYVQVRIPGYAQDNLGLDASLDQGQLPLVGHVESVAVLPGFRGLGLQRQLTAAAEEMMARRGLVWSMATVAPQNPHSLGNFTSMGYCVVCEKEKYGGHKRCILLKKLC